MRKLKSNELGRISVEEYAAAKKTPLVVVLDNIRSANNVGSVFRTSDAFLIERIVLCGISSTPPNNEIHKTALGSEESVPWEYVKDTVEAVEKLKANGYKVFAIEQVEDSTKLQNFDYDYTQPLAVVFGNEVNGVLQSVVDICDGSIEIPQFGTKHSLNISVTCGIVLWDLSKKYLL